MSQHDNMKEFLFVIFGLIPLIIFMRFFIVGTIAWIGAVIGHMFWWTRWIWIGLAYILTMVWWQSSKIAAVAIPVVGISYYFGYRQPLDYSVGVLWYVFWLWPMWVLNLVVSTFS